MRALALSLGLVAGLYGGALILSAAEAVVIWRTMPAHLIALGAHP